MRWASDWVTSLAFAALVFGCDRQQPDAVPTASASASATASTSAVHTPQAKGRRGARVLTWRYPATDLGPLQVVVSVPASAQGQRFFVLVAMHGRGEANKGPARGARGWIDDYGLLRAVQRLANPPLVASDFGNMVEQGRLSVLNRRLASEPYPGLIVVCPYTPDLLAGEGSFTRSRPFASFLVEEILPRVRRETPALAGPEATGIDGVSLGGRASLLVAFERPKAFGVVAATQAAFDDSELAALAELGRRAKKENPKLAVRLLTSSQDYFLNVNRALAQRLNQKGVPTTLDEVRGDHSYAFNRGPGVYEMLTHHSWAFAEKAQGAAQP